MKVMESSGWCQQAGLPANAPQLSPQSGHGDDDHDGDGDGGDDEDDEDGDDDDEGDDDDDGDGDDDDFPRWFGENSSICQNSRHLSLPNYRITIRPIIPPYYVTRVYKVQNTKKY